MGCVMMRVCNLDTCPVGIATQNPELRKRFAGKPEYIVNFMMFIAQELREIMAQLGIRTVSELVGRCDLLRVKEDQVTHRAEMIDLSGILSRDFINEEKTHFDPADIYDFGLEKTVDESKLIPEFAKAMKNHTKKTVKVNVSSTDRALGTIFGSVLTEKFGSTLDDDFYTVQCYGGGGQSFGAFIPKGLTLRLEGDSNDYFGKGLSGGKLIVTPPKDSTFKAEENIIIGNVALYGATSGEAYVNGIAGERFCVRNSGAYAVCEGVGDHGCEYMTGGRVVVLGKTGRNFAAGMSGGIAYVYDEAHDLYLKLNKELVTMSELCEKHDIEELRTMIEKHLEATGSPLAGRMLDNFEAYLPNFKKIMPNDYNKMLSLIGHFEEKGLDHEQAVLEAFYAAQKGE